MQRQRSKEELDWLDSLSRYKGAWEALGDKVATSIMTTGLELEFAAPPPMSFRPPPYAVSSESTLKQIRPFLPDWIRRGVVREIVKPQLLFFSHLFVVAKGEDKVRPIIDLSILNKYLVVPSFKMETALKIALNILGPLWGCKIDLKDAYFHVPVSWLFQLFLAFMMDDRIYVFQYLPFGLAVAPWAFTRIIRPVKGFLHKEGLRISSFLDDFLLLAESPEELNRISALVLDLFKRLGFSINKEKSITTPSQSLEYLGVLFLLKSQQLALPQEKVAKVSRLCKEMSQRSHASRRQLESLLGVLSFASSLVPLGRLRLLPLILWMNQNTSTETRDKLVVLGATFREGLEIWQNVKFLNTPVRMSVPTPSLQLMTDASSQGWGGALLPHRVSGVWPQECQSCSMNQLEMLAIFHSLEHFRSTLQGNPVLIMSDNTTAVSCIRNQGTLRSLPLLEISRKLLEFCEEFSIIPVPKHLPGRLNVLADQESRLDPISTEWSLDPETFRGIWNRHGPFACDLFANRFNTQLENFLSPFPDPLAQGTNALSISWDQWDSIYLFPPVPLLHEVVALLSSYQGKGVLIAPLFPASAWFPNLLLRSKEHSRLPPSMSPSPGDNQRQGFPPEPFYLAASRVETIILGLMRHGYSRHVSERLVGTCVDSTLKTNQSAWKKF